MKTSRRRRGSPAWICLAMIVSPLMLTTPLGESPAAGAPAPAWTAYLASFNDNAVTPMDLATNTVGTSISVGTSPYGIAITPNGATAYVTNYGDNTVTPIDTSTNAAGPPIPVGNSPHLIAITPNGAVAYVANFKDNTVTPIDTATNTPGPPISVGSGPVGIAITPDGATAYVTNLNGDSVTPINTATNTAGTPIPVGPLPLGIAITPNGETAYVANEGGTNTVTPINLATNTAGSPISVSANPTWIAIMPDGSTAYVTNSSQSLVTPIDLATDTAETPITVGANPSGIAITPNGSTAYVTDGSGVTPIDTATNTAETPIPAGPSIGIAITPDQSPVAHVSVSPAAVGQPTSFDASASTVAFGTITAYAWNFGDGAATTTSLPTTTHTYAAPGLYTVTVTETDSAGTSTTQVFTGQTMSRNGGASAVASQSFTVVRSSTLTTSVLSPSNGETLSGFALLDATAQHASRVEFRLFGGVYGYSGPVICNATATIFGWLCVWNTSTVPDGSYVMVSEAFTSTGSALSSGVSVTIHNPSPSTAILVPANGDTLSGSAYLDASAKNAAGVEFRLFGGVYGYSGPVVCDATATIFGWLCAWDTSSVPNGSYILVSEAFNSVGATFSSGVSINVDN